jgi:hypothetical protein
MSFKQKILLAALSCRRPGSKASAGDTEEAVEGTCEENKKMI